MKTSHQVIWNNATLQSATAPLNQQVFGNSVCAVRIQNRSVWVLMVTETATGAPVDELPPLSWIMIPNPVDFTLSLLVSDNNLTKPADMKVSVTYVDTPVSYAYGSLSPLSGQSIPDSQVNNTISTDIGVGFPRLKGGGTFYPSSGGTTTVTFAKTSQQIMVFNQGSDQISLWGDEDGNTGSVPTDAINLPGGGNLGVPWATGHIYLATTGTQVPVQVQAWG